MTDSFVGKGARVPKHYVTRLAAALRAGQGAERLYDSYGPGLFGYCWAMVGGADEAAGALTDTMLVATSHADALADPADLTAWVFALARNECLRRRTDAPPTASPYVCAPDADVLTMLVARALTDLRPADRELLDLTVRHRLSAVQLAHTLDLGTDDAAKLAEIAVTRFDQTLSTLFMASSGRLAVPHEIVADRPPLRVLLDLLPPPRPAEELRGNLAAACVDPELDHYRLMVARRALPLDEDGFPRRLDPDRARLPGTPPAVPPQRRPAPPPGARTAYGTAAMPLGAPVAPPADLPSRDRTTGGHPVIEPMDPGLIPPEAVTRARTASPPADPPGPGYAPGSAAGAAPARGPRAAPDSAQPPAAGAAPGSAPGPAPAPDSGRAPRPPARAPGSAPGAASPTPEPTPAPGPGSASGSAPAPPGRGRGRGRGRGSAPASPTPEPAPGSGPGSAPVPPGTGQGRRRRGRGRGSAPAAAAPASGVAAVPASGGAPGGAAASTPVPAPASGVSPAPAPGVAQGGG
ncbi:MAG TPA: hypothetical protein VGL93_31120, partial [Streptosporangiaceae bacterium]